MKLILAILTLCVTAQSALAAGPDCSAVEGIGDRLACYDKASPPKVRKSTAADGNATRTAYKDPFLAEDARTTAKLKTICRGC
jgi:hypothetical protein